jgi:hypothetical protein
MRRGARQWNRADLAWLAAGLVVGQVLLALGVDRSWLAVRDPEFVALRQRLAARQAEAPSRPLVLALGSSRTEMGLRAERLGRGDVGAPLVFNFGVPSSGPMMQQVVLRRLLDDGVRPDLMFVEAIPSSMGRGDGAPWEEHVLDPARLNAAEAARLVRYYHQPHKLAERWALARALPSYRHHAELRDAVGLDGAAREEGDGSAGRLDAYGWRGHIGPTSPDESAARLGAALVQYRDCLSDLEPADGPLAAFRDVLAACRREAIPTAVVIPPEGSAFRERYEAAHSRIDAELHRLAREFDMCLYDARAWVPDDGFWDGHHLAESGANTYTERFGREVLEPELRRLAARGKTAAAR